MLSKTTSDTSPSTFTSLRLTTLAVACLLIAACAVGSDPKVPDAPKASGYTPQPSPEQMSSAATQGGEAQRFVSGMKVSDQWWETFQSDKLNKTIENTFATSPTLSVTQAALCIAQQQMSAQQGALFPLVQGAYQGARKRDAIGTVAPSLALNTEIYSLYMVQVTVSYTPGVFGLNRRQVESLKAAEDAQYFQSGAAHLTLATNIAVAAVQEAPLRAQIDAQKRIVAINTQLVGNSRKQFRLGTATGLDVAVAQSALAQAEQALPNLQKQLVVQRDLLTVLAGKLSGDGIADTFIFADFTLSQGLPLSLPSDLVRQRPDVRAAEEQLHAATAQVGAAIANMLPQLTLSATRGGTAPQFSQMFQQGNVFWSLIDGVAQTFFDGGMLLAKKRVVDVGADQAEAQYRGTVTSAFQNVIDTLHALDVDTDVLKAAPKAEQAARITLDITDRQRAIGQINILAVLSVGRAHQTALQVTIAVCANQFSDTAALFQALGGGWWSWPHADIAQGGSQ